MVNKLGQPQFSNILLILEEYVIKTKMNFRRCEKSIENNYLLKVFM